MSCRLALIVGLTMLAAPAMGEPQRPETAQPAPYPSPAASLSGVGGKASDDLSLIALRNFAICAVQRTPDGAARLLSLDEHGAAYRAELARFAKGHSNCMNNGRIAFGGLLFQGAIAEAMVAQRYGGRPLVGAVEADAGAVKALGEPEAIGLCLVRKRPEAAAALLQSQPASEREHAALNQTVEILPGCVVRGMTMKLNRPAVRAMMALGAYRLLAGNPNPAES